jgi:molybdopterin-guanine dinucleotide biosynthesis protein A
MVPGAARLRNVTFDAIVLAGGRSSRFGVDKAAVLVDGVTMLDRVLLATVAAQSTVVVGPRRPAIRPVAWTVEDPASGGPVAGIAAGLPYGDAPVVAVFSCDLPWLTAPDAARIVAGLSGPARPSGSVGSAGSAGRVDGFGLRDSSGHGQRLATAYRRTALAAAVEALGDTHNRAVRDLVAGLSLGWTEPTRAGDDADTWSDLRPD